VRSLAHLNDTLRSLEDVTVLVGVLQERAAFTRPYASMPG
jgi:hypothetical protein